jgi:hypothetical protein
MIEIIMIDAHTYACMHTHTYMPSLPLTLLFLSFPFSFQEKRAAEEARLALSLSPAELLKRNEEKKVEAALAAAAAEEYAEKNADGKRKRSHAR